MKKIHRKRLIISLLSLQVVFLVLFTLTFLNFTKGRAILGVGMSYVYEDLIVMGFCLVSMINVIVELKKA